MAVVVAAWAEVSIWWFIDVDPSGLGVVSAGKELSAGPGGDGKSNAADTGVSMDG